MDHWVRGVIMWWHTYSWRWCFSWKH